MMGRWSWVKTCLIALCLLLGLYPMGFAETHYVVKTGDSLYKISKTFGISIETIKMANHLEKETLKPNQILLIPDPPGTPVAKAVEKPSAQPVKTSSQGIAQKSTEETEPYVVKKGDCLYTLSKQAGVSIEEIKRLNQLQSTVLRADQILLLPKSSIRTEEEIEEQGDELEVTAEVRAAEDGNGAEGPSETLTKWKSQEEKNLFVRVVKTFLGVPYRLGGSTLKGMDCSAFVKKIYEIFNIELPRTAREQLHAGKWVGKEELEAGDLVFFKSQARRTSNAHVGIYIGNNEFVHASSRTKEVRVDNLDVPYFNKRFLKGVRVKEWEGELQL